MNEVRELACLTRAQVMVMFWSYSHCADCSHLLMKSLCETSCFLPLKHIDLLFFALPQYSAITKGPELFPSCHTLCGQMDAHVSSQLPLTPAFVVCKFSSWSLAAFLLYKTSFQCLLFYIMLLFFYIIRTLHILDKYILRIFHRRDLSI